VPEATPALLEAYGPDGSCWTSEEAAAACDQACGDAIARDFAGHPELAECWPTSETRADTLEIDGTSWTFVDGVVIVVGESARLYVTSYDTSCDAIPVFGEPEHPNTFAMIVAADPAGDIGGSVQWGTRGQESEFIEIAYRLEFDQAISDDLAVGSTVTGRIGLSGKSPAGLAGEDPVGVIGFEVEVCRVPGT
jgi:hypothetical protein